MKEVADIAPIRCGARACRAWMIALCACCCWLLYLPAPLRAAEEGPTLAVTETWADLFGGHDGSWHVTITTPTALQARAGWKLTIDGRAIARGEQQLDVAPDKPATLRITAALPPVITGAIVPAVLTITLVTEGNPAPLATLEKRLWLFPANPFAGHAEWLKARKIRLYDPDGKTAQCLDTAGVPFTRVGNPDALPEPGDELTLIGEGVSFEDYHALPELLAQAAAAGHPVLCLAPTGGVFPLPGAADIDLPAPARLSLRHHDIITELDKRLDADKWPAGDPMAAGVNLRCLHDQVHGEIGKGPGGWPWLELTYPKANSRLIFCGFAIIDQWEAGPTSRFLLARLLEYLAGEAATLDSNSKKEEKP